MTVTDGFFTMVKIRYLSIKIFLIKQFRYYNDKYKENSNKNLRAINFTTCVIFFNLVRIIVNHTTALSLR